MAFNSGSDSVAKYFVKRVIQVIPTLLFVLVTVFLIMKMIPGDPAMVLLGPEARAEDIARFRGRLGLDKPVLVQFFLYLKSVLSGNLGLSLIHI